VAVVRACVVVVVAVLGSALAAGAAGVAVAAPVAGIGEPFSSFRVMCPPGAVQFGPVVAADHVHPLVRATIDPAPSLGGDLDLGVDPIIGPYPGRAAYPGQRTWYVEDTVRAGQRPAVGTDCGGGGPPGSAYAATIELFDRPVAPLHFSDPTASGSGGNAPVVLGFSVAQAGHYVADVSVRYGMLTVEQTDSFRGEDREPDDFWGVRYDAFGVPVTARLRLGRLAAGVHDLPFGFTGGPARTFSITIAPEAPATPPPPRPIPAGETPAAPAASEAPAPAPDAEAPPTIAVLGDTASSKLPRLAVLTAQRAVRSALRRRGYPVSRLRCRRTADRRVACVLSARKAGRSISGTATVTMRAADKRVRYVLKTRVSSD
jgi:hypothetical protein